MNIRLPNQCEATLQHTIHCFVFLVSTLSKKAAKPLLETWSGNKRMLGCARKLGFSEVKRRKDAYVVDGVEYDELLLEKRFDD